METSTAMAAFKEAWRVLARTVPATLELVDALEVEAIRSIVRAKSGLYVRRYTIGVITSGGFVAGRAFDETVSPTEIAEDAFRKMARHNELHNMAANVLALYSGHLRVVQPAPLWQKLALLEADTRWQSWVQHRATALRLIQEVPRRIRSAVSYDMATRDAATVAQGLPAGSLEWNAWVLAAEHLAVRAHEDISMARIEAYQMRDAILTEYFDVLQILDRPACTGARVA